MSNLSNINDLIEQNEAKSQALSVEVDRAINCVNNIEQLITALSSVLTSASQDSQTKLEAFVTALDNVEQAFENELQSAKEGFDTLQQKISELNGEVDTITTAVKSQLDNLNNHADSIVTDIEAETQEIKSNLSELLQQIQQQETEIDNQSETVKADIEEFLNLVEATQTAFNESKDNLIEKYDALEEEFREKLEFITTGFETLLNSSNDNCSNLEEKVETTSSDVIDSINQKFTEEVQNELSGAIENLQSALEKLSQVSEDSHGLLDGGLNDVIGNVGEVLEVIKPIIDVLDEVQNFLG